MPILTSHFNHSVIGECRVFSYFARSRWARYYQLCLLDDVDDACPERRRHANEERQDIPFVGISAVTFLYMIDSRRADFYGVECRIIHARQNQAFHIIDTPVSTRRRFII